ncbi:hypothetical protein Tco_0055233, partial [Tanacetum coccineum]
MPVELGSFDVIIGMDWSRRCHAVIVCDEKLVQVPYGNETLTFYGNESSHGRESQLIVISCSKAQDPGLPLARPVEFQIDLNSKSRTRSSSTFLTLGSLGDLICEKEGWVIQDVHRLLSEIRISPAQSTRTRHFKDGIPNSVWSLRVPGYAIRADKRTC